MRRTRSSRLWRARSIARTPPANDTETCRKAAALQLEGRLQAKLAEWRALHRRFEPAQAWLEGRIAFSQEPQKADLEARKVELDRKVGEARRHIAQADADLAALSDPRSDAATFDAILARLTSSAELAALPEGEQV